MSVELVNREPKPKPPVQDQDEMRAFLLVVRQALLMIVGYIERRYELKR